MNFKASMIRVINLNKQIASKQRKQKINHKICISMNKITFRALRQSHKTEKKKHFIIN